jgi:3-methylcrotonyl-CoA carboxylase beta subunit
LPGDGQVYDGTSITTNPPCHDADQTPWTYNYGIMIAGAAYVRYHHVYNLRSAY